MDGSTPEILVDDNDAQQVTISGPHQKQTSGGYGATWIKMPIEKLPAQITYRPSVQVPGSYTIYAYMPTIEHAAAQTHFIINNGSIKKDVFIIPHATIEGQTSGEWVSLGTYTLQKGNKTTVSITTKGADGVIAADAILFVPQMK
jgi:hypothetical protein